MPKMIVRGKFFSTVKNWTFRHCIVNKEILKNVFVNKSIQKPETMHIINRGDGNHVFSAVLDLKKFHGLKSFKFIGGKITQENLERFVESDFLNNLTHLDLSENIIYDDRFGPFLQNFTSKNLVHLNLRNCGLSFESLK